MILTRAIASWFLDRQKNRDSRYNIKYFFLWDSQEQVSREMIFAILIRERERQGRKYE